MVNYRFAVTYVISELLYFLNNMDFANDKTQANFSTLLSGLKAYELMTRHVQRLRRNLVQFSCNDPLNSATRDTNNKYAQNCVFDKPAICCPLRLQPSSSLGSTAEALRYFLLCKTFALPENTIQNLRSITLRLGTSASSHPFWRQFW